jgi:hypothetical protein
MKHEVGDDRRQFHGFFRDELRRAEAESPSFDDLAAYVEGRLSAEETAELEERIAEDDALRAEVLGLREVHAQMARPPVAAFGRRRWTWTALAAAAAVAVLALWLAPRPPDPGGPDSQARIPPLAALRDGPLRIALAADGSVSGLPSTAGADRAAVADALRGVLPRPEGANALRNGRSALMGAGGGSARFAPQSPVGTRVATDRPTFRWTSHPDARSYQVAVFDQDVRKQVESGPVTATEWQSPRALATGRVYLRQVTAETSRGPVAVPAAPEPEARFEVASPALLAEVERRRSPAPASHLLGALAFVQAGLFDDAGRELEALALENPGSPEVAALRERLGALR